MEHVGSAVAVVGGITYGHHVLPTSSNAASTQSCEAEEEYQERTNNKNRCLDSGKSHYALHTAKHGEHGCDGDQTDGTIPEWNAQQILEEDPKTSIKEYTIQQLVDKGIIGHVEIGRKGKILVDYDEVIDYFNCRKLPKATVTVDNKFSNDVLTSRTSRFTNI